MIAKLEEKLEQMKEAMSVNAPGPKKYRDRAAKDYIRLSRDLDKIYAAYSKLALVEKKIAEKYDIEAGF